MSSLKINLYKKRPINILGTQMVRLKKIRNSRTVVDHRKIADSARDAGNWGLAARHYMEMLAVNSTDSGIWLQYGHMLKELGLFRDAEQCYQRALKLAPDDPEIHLQLGFLAKVSGNFTDALRYLLNAKALNYQPSETIEREIRLCTPRRSFALLTATPGSKPPELRVFLSSVSGTPLDESGTEIKKLIGATNYSYLFIMKGFIAALKELEIPFRVIRNPEFIPDIAARSDAKVNLHIGFYPPNDLRFLKGAYNVISLAWEFERLKSKAETTSDHPFADYVRMLHRADEIWSVSSYGEDALRHSGLERVETVPTPILITDSVRPRTSPPTWSDLERGANALGTIRWIPLAVAPVVQGPLNNEALRRRANFLKIIFSEAEERPPIIFLSIFNVHDYRKQIRPLIEAFTQYSQINRNAYLFLKVSSAGESDNLLNENISNHQLFDPGEMIPPFVSDRIWMTSDVLTREELESLYDCAGFYVCTSHAEGQNLPILEAMARGVVPISVDNTAMNDYITSENSIVIHSQLRPLTPRLASRYGMFGVSTWYVDSTTVYTALINATEIDNKSYISRSYAAMQTVTEKFNVEVFRGALTRIVNHHKYTLTGEKA